MNDVKERALNLIELRYDVLFLEKEIISCRDNQEEQKIDKEELDKIKNIIEKLYNIDKNITNKTIDKNFLNKKTTLNDLMNEINVFSLFTDRSNYKKVEELGKNIINLKKEVIDDFSFYKYIDIFNDCMQERLNDDNICNNFIYNLFFTLDTKHIYVMFKYMDIENQKKFFNGIVCMYNENSKQKVVECLKKLVTEYPYLKDIELLNYQKLIIIKNSDEQFLKLLSELNIYKIDEQYFDDLLLYVFDTYRYDLGLFLFENCKINDMIFIIKKLFEQNPGDDKVKMCQMIISIFESKKFPKINKQTINYIKANLSEYNFGREECQKIVYDEDMYDDSVIELLDDIKCFLSDLISEQFIDDEDIVDDTQELLYCTSEQIDEIKSYNEEVINNSQSKLNNKLLIDKRKFVEDLMSALIDKVDSKLYNYLLKVYSELINLDETIQKEKLVKTLNKILKKNDKQIK